MPQVSTSIEIASGVQEIPCSFEGVPLSVYVVAGDGAAALIDAGIVSTPADHVLPALAELGIAPAALHRVLLTHVHHDHHGGCGALLEANPALTIAAPALEAALLESSQRYLIHNYDSAFPGEIEISDAVRARLIRLCGEGTFAAHQLHPGETVALETGTELEAVATPGHSPGHLAFMHRAASVLFCGDAIQADGIAVDGRPDMFPLYGSVPVYLRSLEAIELAGADVVATAHNGTLDADGAHALIDRSRQLTAELDETVLALLRERRTLELSSATEAIAAAHPRYGRGLGIALTTVAHLDHLASRGEATVRIEHQRKRWSAR